MVTSRRWMTALIALIDPEAAARRVARRGDGGYVPLLILVLGVVVGAVTIPRQFDLLATMYPPVAESSLADLQREIQSGVRRLVVADRVIVNPTGLIGAALVVLLGSGLLGLPRRERRLLWGVVALGLTPLVVERFGEALLTYLVPMGSVSSPGDVITLPHRFVTGPLLMWRAPDPPPGWLEIVDARVNLVLLWCVVIWTVGLKVFDGDRGWRGWHVGLPASALAAAGVVTWLLGPYVLALVLRLG